MRKTRGAAPLYALWGSLRDAGEAPSLTRVKLSLKEPARVEGAGEVCA